MKGLWSELDGLHLCDSCSLVGIADNLNYDLYSCYGIQGLISSLSSHVCEIEVASLTDPSQNTAFNGSLNIDLSYIVLAEPTNRFRQSDEIIMNGLQYRNIM